MQAVIPFMAMPEMTTSQVAMLMISCFGIVVGLIPQHLLAAMFVVLSGSYRKLLSGHDIIRNIIPLDDALVFATLSHQSFTFLYFQSHKSISGLLIRQKIMTISDLNDSKI